jgi:hypothetical protein
MFTAAPSSCPLSPHTRPVGLSKPRIRVKLMTLMSETSGMNVGSFRFNVRETATRALILGVTALTLSAGVASAQVAFVSPDRYGDTGIEDYNNPNETMAQRVGLAPTFRRLVMPPLYHYAPVPTTKSVTAPQAQGPTMKWVTAPQPGRSKSSRK